MKLSKESQKFLREEAKIFKNEQFKSEWYNLRPILGNAN